MKKISMIMFIICFMQLKASDSPPRSTERRICKSVSAASQLGRLVQEEKASPRDLEGKVMKILYGDKKNDDTTKLTQVVRRKSTSK